jgi:hypothetical protein
LRDLKALICLARDLALVNRLDDLRHGSGGDY